jgi:hypothetical protein
MAVQTVQEDGITTHSISIQIQVQKQKSDYYYYYYYCDVHALGNMACVDNRCYGTDKHATMEATSVFYVV